MFDEISGVLASTRGLVSSLLDLLTLEARRAGLALALMLACGAAGALLVAAAWLGLMAVLALWAVAYGSSWQVALAAVTLANLALAAALFWLCARVSRGLLFAATRRQLRRTPLELT
jgi:uncharacterized membrane protein YqjE